MVLLSHWLRPSGPLPQAGTCQRAAVRGPTLPLVSAAVDPAPKAHWRWASVSVSVRFSQRSAEQRPSRGERGKRRVRASPWGPRLTQPPASGGAGGRGRWGWRVLEGCVLMAPERGRAQAHLCDFVAAAVCSGHRLQDQPRYSGPEEPAGRPAGSWAPSSLGDDTAGSGTRPWGAASRALLPVSHDWTSEGGSCAWEPGPFSSEQGMTFAWLQGHC